MVSSVAIFGFIFNQKYSNDGNFCSFGYFFLVRGGLSNLKKNYLYINLNFLFISYFGGLFFVTLFVISGNV